jgi:hypothetical protein
MNTQNIDKIQSAMNKCLKFKVPVTDDAIAAAVARLEYLILRAGEIYLRMEIQVLMKYVVNQLKYITQK